VTERIGLGVIGAGRIGRLHAGNLARRTLGVELCGIADPRLEAAESCAAFCKTRAFADWRRLLEDALVRAVVVCSPTDTHAAILEAAADAGKHVFCEKPIDLDLERARQAVAAVEGAGLLLQVGFNRRFDPTFRRIGDLVRAGDIGVPQLVRITSRDPAPPPLEYVRSSGGLFLDMTIHDLDMARYLANAEVEEVFARASNLVDPRIGEAGDVDTAAIVLRFETGALALIDNSRRAVYGYDQRLEVFGPKGCLTAPNRTPTEVRRWTEAGQERERPFEFFLDRYEESFALEMELFVEALREGKSAPVTGDDGLRAIELALAALESSRTGNPVRVAPVRRLAGAVRP
jgi:myo-inositol 2-dehydrogenase/D-chiro-inositol 1-dehydrogenase